MSEVLISSAFLFAYRQIAGETPAIRWSRLHFRIAGILPGFLQIRRRNACIPGSRASRLHAVVLNRRWATLTFFCYKKYVNLNIVDLIFYFLWEFFWFW
ncbi:MAG: hypothetical protein LBP59_04880 [Planctomycetaceae bacterium]|nr:hypothetical protein [Planctomycetaceae bacterium]